MTRLEIEKELVRIADVSIESGEKDIASILYSILANMAIHTDVLLAECMINFTKNILKLTESNEVRNN